MEIVVSAMAVLVALSCLVALVYTEILSKDENDKKAKNTGGRGFDQTSADHR